MKLCKVFWELSLHDIEDFIAQYLELMNPESELDPDVCCYQVPDDDDHRPGIGTISKGADELYSENEYDIIMPLIITVSEDYDDFMRNIDRYAGLTGLERLGLHCISIYDELRRIVEARYKPHIVDPVRLIEMMANRFKPFVNYRGEHDICRVVKFDTNQDPYGSSYNYCVEIEFANRD